MDFAPRLGGDSAPRSVQNESTGPCEPLGRLRRQAQRAKQEAAKDAENHRRVNLQRPIQKKKPLNDL